MDEEVEITLEDAECFRTCRFVRRVFKTSPAIRAKLEDGGVGLVYWRYTGEPFDPEKYVLQEGVWNHDHCEICFLRVEDGMTYWPNESEEGGDVCLCERCYPRVMALLGGAPALDTGNESDTRSE